MTANSDKSKQNNKAAHRVLAGVLCGASVLSLVLSLVMPPISQAIANDAQSVSTEETVTGGGSSSESAGVNNTTEDAEKQNSDETEGDDQIQPETQLENELREEDDKTMDSSAAPSAEEAAESEEATTNINNAEELRVKILGVGANQTASFTLTADIDYADEITLNKSDSKITLNLNGHKITHSGNNSNKPLFSITNKAALTLKDSSQGQDLESAQSGGIDGNLAKMEYVSDIPSKLTYYVTKSVVSNGVGTAETLYKHEVAISGAIVSTAPKDSSVRLINVYAGGSFNLDSGVLTQLQNRNVGSLIYAENGSTVNMCGGYVCGATAKANASSAGAGVNLQANGDSSTFNMSGGVIASNYAPNGGGLYSSGSNVNISGNAVISGNATFDNKSFIGYGGGVMASGGKVNVSGGYITNNKMAAFCGDDGSGCHGGGGLAANNGAQVTISGGQITGNCSEEAGGGVYVTDINRNTQTSRDGMAKLNITGGIIAANVTNRSEGAGIRVGQMVDATIEGTEENHVYITNNKCMSRYDWGGGGIFVQGESDASCAYRAGKLNVYNSYINSNEAGGYGGGVAVCPTGKTLLTNNYGTAIFGNDSAGNEQSYKSYEQGNDGNPHLSGGGHGKNQDYTAYTSDKFRDNGHTDFFLAAEGHTEPIAAVTGKMLGGGDAKYSGSKELTDAIAIPANGGVQVYNSIGLSSGVKAGDPAATAAQNAATTFITGNYSWNHGGGIMSNGNLYLGTPADTYVYPSLKLKATKQLVDSNSKDKLPLSEGQFSFTVYRKDSTTAGRPSWSQRKFNDGGCTKVATVSNNADGTIAFNLGEQYAAGGEDNRVVYYLVEDGGSDPDVVHDQTVYEIDVKTEDRVTPLIDGFKIHSCTIRSVKVTKHAPDGTSSGVESTYKAGECEITANGASTFTNSYTKYDSEGSWTPRATKVVEGGEMKEFTLQLANDKESTDIVSSKSTTAGGNDKSQTLDFDEIKYALDDLTKGEDPTGRGASKTFTYYVREQQPNMPFTNYKYDQSVYQITVKAADDSNGKINISATYKQIQDCDGAPVTNGTERTFSNTDTPTFTNTYSTTLPLSGMSGVTLTYLAGAAVLCAAAAWMHIRRKANAKGGERRE